MRFSLLFLLHFCFLLPIESQDRFSLNRKVYSPGSPVFFQISLHKDSYIYILNQNSGGTLHLVFPNIEDAENLFIKGNYRIPNAEAGYELQMEEDIGQEIFYLLVSKREISTLHIRNFRDNESLMSPQWLRKLTSELYPWEWKIYELKVDVKSK